MTIRRGAVPVAGDALVQRFRRARRDPAVAVLEGFHALKHALRFGAEVIKVISSDTDELFALVGDLAPDLLDQIVDLVERVEPQIVAATAPHAPRTGVMAIARRPVFSLPGLLADTRPAPVVLLEEPRNMGNMGACVRVGAAADAAGILTLGTNDPWAADAVRGAAGLHFALPVARIFELPPNDRLLLAIDPDGEPLSPRRLPPRAILAFGTERYGLSDELLAQAHTRIRIPMQAGVSSLNLATSVAAVLFAWRLSMADDT